MSMFAIASMTAVGISLLLGVALFFLNRLTGPDAITGDVKEEVAPQISGAAPMYMALGLFVMLSLLAITMIFLGDRESRRELEQVRSELNNIDTLEKEARNRIAHMQGDLFAERSRAYTLQDELSATQTELEECQAELERVRQ